MTIPDTKVLAERINSHLETDDMNSAQAPQDSGKSIRSKRTDYLQRELDTLAKEVKKEQRERYIKAVEELREDKESNHEPGFYKAGWRNACTDILFITKDLDKAAASKREEK